MKIKKGDTVLITTGKDKGKTGKVTKSIPNIGKIVIAGLNTVKKHTRANSKNPHGGIIDIHAPIQASDVLVVCPRCNKATRIGYKLTEKSKMRICKKCNESVDTN